MFCMGGMGMYSVGILSTNHEFENVMLGFSLLHI